jgi:hypothetical protein
VDSRSVHLDYFGTVEHDTGAVNIYAALQFPKKDPPVFHIQSLRQLLYCHSGCSKCHIHLLT